MRIVDVQAYYLTAKLDAPFAWSLRRTDSRTAVVVKVTTDEGIVGWGEAGSSGTPAIGMVIVSQFRPRLIGRDPFDIEVIWEDLYALTRDAGQKGTAIDAISGIDIALWDIIGKSVGKPLHKLLGGAFRSRIAAYATGLYYGTDDPGTLLRARVTEANLYREQGYRAVKMKIGGLEIEDDLAQVQAVRETIGPEIALMVDANHAYNAYSAIRIGRRLEEYDVVWIEEPVVPEDVDGYLRVQSALTLAIAGGECEYTRFGFLPLITRRAVDIVQPDLGRVGGVTEAKKVAALASAAQLGCIPHVWGTGIIVAAALHLLAALPSCPAVRNPRPIWQEPILEFDRTPNPLRGRVAPDPPLGTDGTVEVPTAPGLGIEVDEAALDFFGREVTW